MHGIHEASVWPKGTRTLRLDSAEAVGAARHPHRALGSPGLRGLLSGTLTASAPGQPGTPGGAPWPRCGRPHRWARGGPRASGRLGPGDLAGGGLHPQGLQAPLPLPPMCSLQPLSSYTPPRRTTEPARSRARTRCHHPDHVRTTCGQRAGAELQACLREDVQGGQSLLPTGRSPQALSFLALQVLGWRAKPGDTCQGSVHRSAANTVAELQAGEGRLQQPKAIE